MKQFLAICLFLLCLSLHAQVNRKLEITRLAEHEYRLVVDSTLHEDYGLAYPITYEFSCEKRPENILVEKKASWKQNYKKIVEKTSDDFYNGIEVVRWDASFLKAYVSVQFDEGSDTLYLRFLESKKKPFSVNYKGIVPYYDNRKAVVTCTADDWSDYEMNAFDEFIHLCRKHKLWVSAGIITCKSDVAWERIQQHLDSGYVEAAAHSCNHLHTPYKDPVQEVSGCKQQIVSKLQLSKGFRKGKHEYVYPWLAPFGEYDAKTDSLVSKEKYLVSRKVNNADYEIAKWEDSKQKFSNIGMAYEMGDAPWGGVRDLTRLNTTFDKVYNEGKVYHLMVHPFVLRQYGSWDKDYIVPHIEHISLRKDVWYVALGHLYVYRLLE